MPYVLEADARDALRVVSCRFKVESAPGNGMASLVFETEEELDRMCGLMKRSKLPFVRVGYRVGSRRPTQPASPG